MPAPRRDRALARAVIRLVVALAVLGGGSAATAGIASAQGSGYYVTFVARSCPAYTDIYANRARNDILESLKDLGPDTQYGDSGRLVNPDDEETPPQNICTPITGWQFTLGRSYQSRAVTGPWGSLSIATNVFSGPPIVTQATTPLLDQNAQPIGNETLAGATTVELTNEERAQASSPDQLWTQGGTPTDPVLTGKFPGPQYGFGALRCATDNLNGDNVEYIFFPAGVTHVFCYGLYVEPPPTAGTITIEKRVVDAPLGDDTSFPFNGNISYNPNGFTLANGGSVDFYRAGGSTWDVTEGTVENFRLGSIDCTAVAPDGTPGDSTSTITGGTAAIHLVAGDHVTCVYTNQYVPPRGGLTVRKVTRGGVGTFPFVVTYPSGRHRRLTATTTQPNVPVDAEPGLLALRPGQYAIHELLPPALDGHWDLTRVQCKVERASGGAANPVHVEVRSDENTTCTFTNRFIPNGSIAIDKITHGGIGVSNFLVQSGTEPPVQYVQHATTTTPGVAAPAVPGSSADATDHIALGRYSIIEQLPPSAPSGGWSLTSVTCNGVLEPFDQGTVNVRLTHVAPATHCVFTDAFTSHPTPPPPEPPEPPNPPPEPPVGPNPPAPIYALSDLAVTKQASHAAVTVGQSVTYKITVRNLGPDAAQRVALSDRPHPPATIDAVHAPNGARCSVTGTIICQLGTIKPGAHVVVTVSMRPTSASRAFINRAVVGTATVERTLANNAASATVRVIAPSPPPPGRG